MWSLCWKIRLLAGACCSQVYLRSALQPSAALCSMPLFPAAFWACTNTDYQGKCKPVPHLLLILTDWNMTDVVCNTILHPCLFLYTKAYSGGRKLCSGSAAHWRSKLGHLEVTIHSFFFFLLLRALPTTLREAPKKASCPYANTKIHMPIICTWHGSMQVLLTPQFSCIDFKWRIVAQWLFCCTTM